MLYFKIDSILTIILKKKIEKNVVSNFLLLRTFSREIILRYVVCRHAEHLCRRAKISLSLVFLSVLIYTSFVFFCENI